MSCRSVFASDILGLHVVPLRNVPRDYEQWWVCRVHSGKFCAFHGFCELRQLLRWDLPSGFGQLELG